MAFTVAPCRFSSVRMSEPSYMRSARASNHWLSAWPFSLRYLLSCWQALQPYWLLKGVLPTVEPNQMFDRQSLVRARSLKVRNGMNTCVSGPIASA